MRLKDVVCEAECDLKNKVESVRTSKCGNVARTGATTLAQDSVRGREYEGERCGARLGRLMREKCEVTLEVDESMPHGTQC